MPRADYMPALDFDFGVGDAANPLVTIQHRNRHYNPPIRFREGPKLDEHQRDHLLSRHCSKRGRKHDWAIRVRDGVACLWCGLVRADYP